MRPIEKITTEAIVLVFFIVLWSVLIYYFTPSEIIEYVGITNGYLVVLLGGFLGGVSIFFPFPNYLVVLTFGAAGLNPLILGFLATVGVVLGESTSYFFGHTSHSLLPIAIHERVHKINAFLFRLNYKTFSLILFLIGAIPIPNDIFIIPLGLLRYSFWKVILPIGLGNLFYNLIFAFFGYYFIG